MSNEEREYTHGCESGGDTSSAHAPVAPATYDERLNHILGAATDVIARQGYQKASMRAVSRAAGVSLAGIYHYFDSKEKMLFLIQIRTYQGLIHNVEEALLGVDDSIEQLRVMIRAHVTYFAANLPAIKACSHELDALSGDAHGQMRSLRRQYYDLTRSIVDQIHEQGHSDESENVHASTMTLFGALNWLYRWYDPARDLSPTHLARQIADQFLWGLLRTKEKCAQVTPTDHAGHQCCQPPAHERPQSPGRS